MKMPASFAEFSDALQKARIKDGSFCKNELTCIHYNGLTHAMIGWNANLYDLNLFAQRLASLTEEQKKGMDALLKIKQNHRVAPIPLNQLINLTYNTDICCFAPRVSNHEELGAFLYANEMLSNEAMALLDTTEEGSGFQERLLELLGEQHQEDHGGVFTDFGYAELGGEIKDIYVCQSNETACFHRSDAPVVLEVRKGFFNDPSYDNDKTAVLNLPAADAGIAFRSELSRCGMIQSLSGTGHCFDNARMESFFATLKKEKIYQIAAYKLPREQVKTIIFRYIFIYYNRVRVYTRNPLGLPPVKYQEWAQAQTAA